MRECAPDRAPDGFLDAQGQRLRERGYGFSWLSAHYESFEREHFIDTLNDWRWTSTRPAPDWYAGRPRTG